ncbi:hypothetical protein QMO40_00355 [Mannheimia bovis]|uniref:hypothetical protein n=1 Tax=Mannheimia bovis TaxID=2770636 RepID=UPI0024B80E69|nr:hypothetical protein [Mannheimia bovis]WHP47165.1 hypothetical protein QMO40_00355 [Mannheimia bovis]
MRKELKIALSNHIKNRCDQYGNNLEKLRDLYSEFNSAQYNQIEALDTLQELLFNYAISNDNGEENILSARQILGICFLMQNCIDILSTAKNAKENLESPILKLLKQGAE